MPTRNPLLINVLLAQKINRLSGGVVIAPWDVPYLDETYTELFDRWDTTTRAAQAGNAEVASVQAAWRKSMRP